MTKANILIIEDNKDLCQTLADVLRKEGHKIRTSFAGEHSLSILKKDIIDLVLLDIKLPDYNGIDILRTVKEMDPDILVIVITALTDAKPAVDAMKMGAYDYLMKPFELDELKLVVAKALETQELKREVTRLKHQHREHFPDTDLYGNSKPMRELKKLIKIVADTPKTSVLIQGESGTGKELVANAIHDLSSRADKPLIKINCSAIPENLLESELFGHEKGAFTDAKNLKKGIFETANNGTIFLDEISSMQMSIQPKFLRVLETQSFRRIGGTSDITIDVRIIAATNRNLEECVEQQTFREDLYYRLKVMVINIPPLRERPEDILPLAMLFIDRNNKDFGKETKGISKEAQERLIKYHWPGNVRELKNVIERAVILCNEAELQADHLPLEIQDGYSRLGSTSEFSPPSLSYGESLEDMEKRHIMNILKKYDGNKSKTARVLNISRSTLREKMKNYGIA
ncbi:sigma-54-dependent Fis family transcriptional regulator [candidate division KSB1 bacterium]|nr:sigma-54-dependent Fis family transcriptional regulator [candidate division KSB1 bacterium]NIR70922.1 sigma-54-dependent Fis family transcriptional regulator [candidate division KSB1 bacterium]NIS23094.1 sigma-54-dependent Fis family transcriptional regulator [candidate division KSB1 bacterium]NIT69929.1 sigma-54-dependent Fis family transcriptional regulator [candidate division KSB1 bacterium]NIU23595.1 sigma-54-dependent Fis family transcriptional regulator [candidate division KSB1 bacteri